MIYQMTDCWRKTECYVRSFSVKDVCELQRKRNADYSDKLLSCCCCWPRTSRFKLLSTFYGRQLCGGHHDQFVWGTQQWHNSPFTVRETSFSPAPTRGTTARQTYFPASSCLTFFRVSRFSLLRTCRQEKFVGHQLQWAQKNLCISDSSQAGLRRKKYQGSTRTT